MEICPICKKEFEEYDDFAFHMKKEHKLWTTELYTSDADSVYIKFLKYLITKAEEHIE